MLCFASHGQPNCHSSICVCTQVKILNCSIGTEREGNLDDRRNALYTFTRQLGTSPDSFLALEGVMVSPRPNTVQSPMVKLVFTWLIWFIRPYGHIYD